MPTVLTRGAGSARGFGLFESGVTTRKEAFTSNGSWTCPAGVTSLIYLRGKGQNATSDYPEIITFSYTVFGIDTGTGPNSPFAAWGSVVGDAVTNYGTVINSVGLISGPTSIYTTERNIYPNDTWSFSSTGNFNFDGYYISNVSNVLPSGNAQSGGIIVYAGGTFEYGSWYFSVTRILYGSVGANTTAFGYTFSGGTLTGSYPNQVGNSAVTTTYTGVSVTPGTTYSIVVPSGGSVEFAYYT